MMLVIIFAALTVSFVVLVDVVLAQEHQKKLAAIYRRDVEENIQESNAVASFEARRKHLQQVQQGLIDQMNARNINL